MEPNKGQSQGRASAGTSVPTHMPDVSSKRFLTVRERENIQRQLGLNASIAQATSDSYGVATEGGTPVVPPGFNYHKARLNEQAKTNLAILKELSPIPLNSQERDAVKGRLAELEEDLKKNQVLETFSELRVTKRYTPEWHTAIKKAQMRPQWEAKIAELKNCRKLLDPENDQADNLDYLRKQRD